MIEQWTNAGNATPAAAFETVFSALKAGDPVLAASLVSFSGEDGAVLSEIFQSLPQSARDLFINPKFMFMVVGLTMPAEQTMANGCEVLDETFNGPDEALVRYRMPADPRVRSMTMKSDNSSWKMAAPLLGLQDRR